MPWIVESIDGEALGKLRHDLFEQIELCSERMQENENGTLAGLYIAELGAANVDGLDRNVRRPAQCSGRPRLSPQRLHDKRDEPQPDSDGNKDEQRKQDRIHYRTLGVYHEISTDLRLAREDIAASLIFLGERILDRHAHAAPRRA